MPIDVGTVRAFSVARCGTLAREMVTRDGAVCVLAVLERAVYLEASGGIACLCGPGVSGPIALELAAGSSLPAITLGMRGMIDGGQIRLPDGITIDCRAATPWQPPAISVRGPRSLGTGLQLLHEAIAGRCPADGLAPVVLECGPGPRTGLDLAAARAPIALLRDALPDAIRRQRCSADAIAAATSLLGLGPGLTPSGDDLVSGLLIVLRTAGCGALADCLWAGLAPSLERHTTPIGASYVRAAARGLGSGPFHGLMNNVLTGSTAGLAQRLEAALAIGHTSGWDTISGLVIGLEAIVAVEFTRAQVSAQL